MAIPAKLIVPALLWCCAGPALAGNIVDNPGFEDYSTGWESEHFGFGVRPLWAHTGPGMARLTYCDDVVECLGTLNRGAYLGQLLATGAGQRYDLSFWVRSFTGASRFSVFWDGALLTETGTPNGPMLEYRFSGLLASANATLLQVHGYNSLNEHLAFDDFSVVNAAPAPVVPALVVSEPAALSLLLGGMAALAFARRRRSS